jgi:hypothetical protein
MQVLEGRARSNTPPARVCGCCHAPTAPAWASPPPPTCKLQKCETNAFCKRNRGAASTYSVDAKSVQVAGGVLSAVVRNAAAKHDFNLTIKAYGPIVRILVDELPSKDAAPRYQVRVRALARWGRLTWPLCCPVPRKARGPIGCGILLHVYHTHPPTHPSPLHTHTHTRARARTRCQTFWSLALKAA